MDHRIGNLLLVLLISVRGHVAEGDRDFKMCGTWLHSNSPRTLHVDLQTGCSEINISANASTLSIRGSITTLCSVSEVLDLKVSDAISSPFCVFWNTLLDQLVVELNGKNFKFCNASGIQSQCCTHFSSKSQKLSQSFGIKEGSVHGDLITSHVVSEYRFNGEWFNCKEHLCSKTTLDAGDANMIEEVVMNSVNSGPVDLQCVKSTVIEMKEDFAGTIVTLPASRIKPQFRIPSVELPAGLNAASRKTSKVVCSYYRNSTFFQTRFEKKSQMILDDVVGISVQNEIIKDLPEPVRITFHHLGFTNSEYRKCVYWDTRKDNEVMWRETGCVTVQLSAAETECSCNHLTYFAILVDMKPGRRLHHREALTFITAVCCAISIASCAILFISFCRQRKLKNQSSLVHRGLIVALFFLLVFFVISPAVANVASEFVCTFIGVLLHYMLVSVFCWMGVEVIHTFWMMYKVFNPPPKPWIWYLLGFGLPALPVMILVSIGGIYGQLEVMSQDIHATPYKMCWMTKSGEIAHYIVNLGLLAAVVSSGLVMLFLVFRKIRNRDEWMRNRVAFLSIWGLSCLFGSTWLLFLFTGESSETVLFIFCIINSLQGFFLMLRFFILERMQKKSQSSCEFSSSGSTRQHMLQTQEKTSQ